MNDKGDGEESTPPQVAIQPIRVGLLRGGGPTAWPPHPPRACHRRWFWPFHESSHTLLPERSQASWIESQKLILCCRISQANRQNRWMALGVWEQKAGKTDDRSSGFINIFGETLVKNSDIKQSLGNNIYTSTGQDSRLILPQTENFKSSTNYLLQIFFFGKLNYLQILKVLVATQKSYGHY